VPWSNVGGRRNFGTDRERACAGAPHWRDALAHVRGQRDGWQLPRDPTARQAVDHQPLEAEQADGQHHQSRQHPISVNPAGTAGPSAA
jgi:hypothetical protein